MAAPPIQITLAIAVGNNPKTNQQYGSVEVIGIVGSKVVEKRLNLSEEDLMRLVDFLQPLLGSQFLSLKG